MELKGKVLSSAKDLLAVMNPSKVHYPDILYNYLRIFALIGLIADGVIAAVDSVQRYIGMA